MTSFACPRHRAHLEPDGTQLVCADGDRYDVVGGIPVLLDPEIDPTQPGYWATAGQESYPSEERPAPGPGAIDPYVRWLLRGTCGKLYDGARITQYPIPPFPLRGRGRLLDVGSNWGRWSIAAARVGYEPVALDPSLGAARAARRVAVQLGVRVEPVVGDARHLPFPDGSFDAVFSYSVLQHFAAAAVVEAVAECARVLRPGGISLHQLPGRFGLRSLQRQTARRFRAAEGFEVRYWRPRDLESLFERLVGPTALSADGYLTLNPHPGNSSDLGLPARAVVAASRALTRASRALRPLTFAADSLWVWSTRSDS